MRKNYCHCHFNLIFQAALPHLPVLNLFWIRLNMQKNCVLPFCQINLLVKYYNYWQQTKVSGLKAGWRLWKQQDYCVLKMKQLPFVFPLKLLV